MNQPRVLEGAYVADDGRRVIEYKTYCEYCLQYKACKKRRAPIEGCDTVGEVVFLVDNVRKASWSGVITVRQINSIVKQHLECPWDAVPSDIAMPERQMTFAELGA